MFYDKDIPTYSLVQVSFIPFRLHIALATFEIRAARTYHRARVARLLHDAYVVRQTPGAGRRDGPRNIFG